MTLNDEYAHIHQLQQTNKCSIESSGAGLKPSSRTGRASTAGGREPTASPVIAAISAKLKAGRRVKPREDEFELEGIPHPELFTPEQRHALRKLCLSTDLQHHEISIYYQCTSRAQKTLVVCRLSTVYLISMPVMHR